MKTRSGYVSNSSSSSFIIVGRYLEEDLENISELRRKGLKYYMSDEDGPCVGVYFDINDDETWGKYKERVAKELTDLGISSEAKDIKLCSGTYQC
jgi:hypothetical protein